MNAACGVWAIVPVKAFGAAKRRLASAYRVELRRGLARVMLEDVLDTLSRVSGIAGVVVVTSDPEAAGLARGFGAEVLDEPPGGGLNPAVQSAAAHLARAGRGCMLVLPGDIPGVTVGEVEALLAFHGAGRGLSLVPAHDGRGTNALVVTPPEAVRAAFGGDSFARHLEAGRAAGLAPRASPLPGIALDLDHPRDVASFARVPTRTRTWRYLRAQGLVTADEPETAV